MSGQQLTLVAESEPEVPAKLSELDERNGIDTRQEDAAFVALDDETEVRSSDGVSSYSVSPKEAKLLILCCLVRSEDHSELHERAMHSSQAPRGRASTSQRCWPQK